MNPRNDRIAGSLTLLLVGLLVGGFAVASTPEADDDLPDALVQSLSAPVRAWIGELKESENQYGKPNKRGNYSRAFKKVDDTTYTASVHVNTAEATEQVTERFTLTLKEESRDTWKVVDEKLEDTFVGLYRPSGGMCYPFEKFNFDREGMKLSASNGSMCETYLNGEIVAYGLWSKNMSYAYAPPAHTKELHVGQHYGQMHGIIKKDHEKEMLFDPAAILFQCDAETCLELIAENFTGLNRAGGGPESATIDASSMQHGTWASSIFNRWLKERKENAFAHFETPPMPGNKYFSAFVVRELDPLKYPFFDTALPGSGVSLEVNNWAGWEVQFNVWPRRLDIPEQLFGTIYGYYSEETLENSDPYALEIRDDEDSRWHEVYSVKGQVDLGLEDPEMVEANMEFGITLKQDLRVLPFFIQAYGDRTASGKDKPARLYVNSIRHEGKELTWIRTSSRSGLVVLPEEMPKGTRLQLAMDFDTRAILKRNHAFSQLSRFGWLPFVRFADFIDEFEMTIRTPSKYTILGIGHKVDETIEGDVKISHWQSDSPVVFPTIIFGKYVSSTAKFDAFKGDGKTVIPVEVHVDEVSMMHLAVDVDTAQQAKDTQEAFNAGARGIRGKQLETIAEQAANSINLYTEISGIDYPYGELNLVNDPAPALYGQAPSSLIYLGSLVFRGAGTMAGGGLFGGGSGSTGTSKFLKSVTAHEVGHQWWGSRVSNANQRNYWFVESLAEYFSALYLENVYSPKEYQEQVDEWRTVILDRGGKSSVQSADTIWQGESGGARQALLYNRGPYAFHMLRELFKGPDGNEEKFFQFLKAFSMELAEKREIVTLDIQHAAEKGLGGIDPDGNPYTVDLGWFFDQWIRGVGLPQYKFDYTVRQSEDKKWIIEGVIQQRIVVGNSRDTEVMEGQYWRGVVDLTVKTKKEEYERRLIIDGPETPFRLKVPLKPIDVMINEKGETLAHDILVNKSWN